MGTIKVKRIITYVGSNSEYNFFSRLAKSVKPLNYSFVFLTPKLSLYWTAKLNGFDCHLIHNSPNRNITKDILQTSEVKGGFVTNDYATGFYHAVNGLIELLHKQRRIDLVAVWNGLTIPTKALVQYAHNNGIKTLFFELSNIPGKIFVDPKGVNAQSLLFSSANILDKFSVDNGRYKDWKEKYLIQKRIELTTATAVNQQKINNYFFILDVFGTKFMNLPSIGNMNIITKMNEKIFRSSQKPLSDEYDFLNGQYIFYPMQVSNDSQLLFNSSINNVEGIKYCIEIATKQNLNVVVKPHPTENNQEIFEQLRRMQHSYSFTITNEPTMKILEYAQEVITINSTVGLEAIILGKKISFLGKTFYSFFNEKKLQQYIMGYLIDVDYFSTKKINQIAAGYILERSELK